MSPWKPATVVGMLAVALALAACGSNDKKASATPSAQAATAECPGGKVTFGIEPYEDPAKLKPAYQVLAGALQKRLGCPVQLQIVEDYTAEVLAMQNGKLDIAEFGPLGFVFAQRRAKAEAVASFADGSGKLTTYTGGIWVPKDSAIRTLADLKGKSLALSEPGSTSGDALPRYALKTEAGLDTKRDLKLEYAGGHPEALLALTKGKVDAAEINSQQQATSTGEGQFKASDFREIWTSKPIPNDPVTVRSGLPPAFKAQVKKALLQLSSADVAKVGKFLAVDPPGPMVAVSQRTYQPLFDLADALGLTQKDV
jgi:phosphonate transport system substrate-binding protein